MQAQSNTTATVYAAAYALRDALLADFATREAAGALTFLITAWAALQSRAARLAAQQPQPTPPAAPALPRRPRAAVLVPSESDPKLVYIVRNFGQSCTCPGFHFRGRCKHATRAQEQRRQQIRTLLDRANARHLAAA